MASKSSSTLVCRISLKMFTMIYGLLWLLRLDCTNPDLLLGNSLHSLNPSSLQMCSGHWLLLPQMNQHVPGVFSRRHIRIKFWPGNDCATLAVCV